MSEAERLARIAEVRRIAEETSIKTAIALAETRGWNTAIEAAAKVTDAQKRFASSEKIRALTRPQP